jgi:hypothetical protein
MQRDVGGQLLGVAEVVAAFAVPRIDGQDPRSRE